jgi:hypothetical protein
MGSRGDYSRHEKKKTKKRAKKINPVTLVAPPVEVEVVRRGKKREGSEPEVE